jgi:hypothetical protein
LDKYINAGTADPELRLYLFEKLLIDSHQDLARAFFFGAAFFLLLMTWM